MASKIKVDNIENQCGGAVVTKCGATTTISGSVVKADDIQAADGGNIINQCGTTITLGASGDTINLASGASQSGFGREGTVNWQTGSIKTATFTAVNGEGYFCNTSGGAFTVNLPAGSAGAIVSVSDYTRTFATNNLTISPNGSEKIGGVAADAILSTNGQAATFVYVDGTEGWINVQETSSSIQGTVEYVSATGGTKVNSGDYTYHTFTGPATFCVAAVSNTTPSRNNVCMMVVAGGGGGGQCHGGGGGGAGGYREFTSVPINVQGYPITVGAGGAPTPNTPGSPSTAISNTSTGGGGGGNQSNAGPRVAAGTGGSGGGAAGGFETQSGAAGNTPPVSPPQGNSGGNAIQPVPSPSPTSGYAAGAGGGGATGSGSNPSGSYPFTGGAGGNGSNNLSAWATITSTGDGGYYAGGGGGGGWDNPGGNGGAGGGGDGADSAQSPAPSGTANTGGGGGGSNATGAPGRIGGAGGSGIVIIRYKYQN